MKLSHTLTPSRLPLVSGYCQHGETCDIDCLSMQLTVACNADGSVWNYQAGSNSYTGGAYGLPHWAVVHLSYDITPEDRVSICADIQQQLEDLLNS